jgi:hypothetical protein
LGKLLKGTIGDVKALLNYSKKQKQKILREKRILEEKEQENEEDNDEKDTIKMDIKINSSGKKTIRGKREDSPYRLKPTWKSKSRQNSKNKKKRTASNTYKRRRKFSNSDEELSKTANNVSPFPKVPNNTHAQQFYSKTQKQNRNFTNLSNKKSKSRKRKLSRSKYSSQKKEKKSRDRKEKSKVLLAGSRDLKSDGVNLIIGDKNNEISQMYSNMGLEFGRKSDVLLKSLKFGYDMDYITGIQAEYYVGTSSTIEKFIQNHSDLEILKVEDPSKIKGKSRVN